jgi:hypothetical protein
MVNALADLAARKGWVSIIAYRDWGTEGDLPARVKSQIGMADFVVVVATVSGHQTDWVNQEIAYSQRLQPPKRIIIVADTEMQVEGDAVIHINRENPIETIGQVSQRISQMIQDQNTRNLLGGLLIGGLILWLLSSSGKEHDEHGI